MRFIILTVMCFLSASSCFGGDAKQEYFYQLQGDVVVRIIEDGRIKDVLVREGETFFIPGGVPHSPQRPPGTIGVVVERRRPPGETEHLQFYCPHDGELVYDKDFDCKDIVEHFRDAMEAFWADESLSTCKNCGTRVTKPQPGQLPPFPPHVMAEIDPGFAARNAPLAPFLATVREIRSLQQREILTEAEADAAVLRHVARAVGSDGGDDDDT